DISRLDRWRFLINARTRLPDQPQVCKGLMDLAMFVRALQHETGDFRLEVFARCGTHHVAALHCARRRGERTTARILKGLSWREYRLRANDTGPTHFLDMPFSVGDVPIA